MTPAQEFLAKSRGLIDAVEQQLPLIEQAADLFTATILAGRMVHVFGSGHSRMMVEEMWPRYGSFPGWNPIVELSLSFHNLVVGANGQRQAMFLENVSGLANRILRNFDLSDQDTALIISSSGCNVVPIEMAEEFQQRGIKVVALVTQKHLDASTTRDARGKKLTDFADIILDTSSQVARLAGAAQRRRPNDRIVEIDLAMKRSILPGATVTLGGIEKEHTTTVSAVVDGRETSRVTVTFAG